MKKVFFIFVMSIVVSHFFALSAWSSDCRTLYEMCQNKAHKITKELQINKFDENSRLTALDKCHSCTGSCRSTVIVCKEEGLPLLAEIAQGEIAACQSACRMAKSD